MTAGGGFCSFLAEQEIRNSNIEIRNKFESGHDQMIKTKPRQHKAVSNIRPRKLGNCFELRASSFVFRISADIGRAL
jgi:hypothetical protein